MLPAQPTGRPCCGRGAGTRASFSVLVIRVRPSPAAHLSKIRRTTAASGSLILRIDVRPFPVRSGDLDVVVPEDASASHMPRTSLALHRVVRPLACLLALELVRERGQRQHDLVGRTVERALAIFKVKEHPHAGLDELLQAHRPSQSLPCRVETLRT